MDISKEDQIKIIESTGILKEEPVSPWAEALLHCIPMFTFTLSMDYLVYQQFAVDYMEAVWTRLTLFPAFYFFAVSIIVLKRAWTQWLLVLGAAFAGSYLIYCTVDKETFGYMKNASPIAVMWIYMIMQLDLLPSVLSLIGPLVYYFRHELSPLLFVSIKL